MIYVYGLGWHGKDGTPGKEGVCNEQTERSLSDCTSTVTTSHTMPAHRCARVRTPEPRLLQLVRLVYIETCAVNYKDILEPEISIEPKL